jgi:hypothetical protein
MNLSRRSFLQTGSKFGLAALVAGKISSIAFGQETSSQMLGTGIGNPVPREALGDPLYNITRAMFTENLKSKFTFRLGEVTLTDMTLIEVNELNPDFAKNDGTRSRDCFSLVFKGPSRLPLRQGTFEVEHSKLGRFQLFIVPGEKNTQAGMRYGAIINRVYP